MNEAATRLSEYLADENAPFDISEITAAPAETPAGQQFRIEDKGQASWALRKITTIERGRQESRAAAQAELERIQAWLADEEKRADQSRGYLDFLLEDYHRRQLVENPKAKTIKLPHGELQLRGIPPEFIRNDVDILNWARKNRPKLVSLPQWVRPDPKLNWVELKKVFKVHGVSAIDPETGEIIPGITVIEQPKKFSIKLTGV